MLLSLLRRGEKTTYLLSAIRKGDLCYALSFLGEYRKKVENDHNDNQENQLKHITILGCPHLSDIYECFDGSYDKIIYTSERQNSELLWFFKHSHWGQIVYIKLNNKILITDTFFYIDTAMQRVKGLTANNIMKYAVYDLDDQAKMVFPEIGDQDIQKYISDLNIIRGKTVILNPYANSISGIPAEFYQRLSDLLIESGYVVVTNVSEHFKTAVLGTKPLACSMPEAYRLAEYCGFVVGTRSGFMDFIISSNCKIVAVYSNESPFKNLFSLHGWGCNDDVLEVGFSGGIESEARRIVAFVEELPYNGY